MSHVRAKSKCTLANKTKTLESSIYFIYVFGLSRSKSKASSLMWDVSIISEGHSEEVSSSFFHQPTATKRTQCSEESAGSLGLGQNLSKWPKINFKTQLPKNKEGLPFDTQCSKTP